MLEEKAAELGNEKMDLIKEKEKEKMDGSEQGAKLEKEKGKLENHVVKAKEEAVEKEATLNAKLKSREMHL